MLDIIPIIFKDIDDIKTYESVIFSSKLFYNLMHLNHKDKIYKLLINQCDRKIINIYGGNTTKTADMVSSFLPHYYVDYNQLDTMESQLWMTEKNYIIIDMTKVVDIKEIHFKILSGGEFYFNGRYYKYNCITILLSYTKLNLGRICNNRTNTIHAYKHNG